MLIYIRCSVAKEVFLHRRYQTLCQLQTRCDKLHLISLELITMIELISFYYCAIFNIHILFCTDLNIHCNTVYCQYFSETEQCGFFLNALGLQPWIHSETFQRRCWCCGWARWFDRWCEAATTLKEYFLWISNAVWTDLRSQLNLPSESQIHVWILPESTDKFGWQRAFLKGSST